MNTTPALSASSPPPLVTVILPCRNEAGHIEACLQSILNQEPPEGGFEVVIADGMSTDGTLEYVQQLARQQPHVTVLSNPRRIASTGLNAAIQAARGEIILRMDAHSTYAPDYIRQCLAVMRETGADNVGGPVRTSAETYMERAIRAVYHSAFAVGGSRFHNPQYEGYVDTVLYGCWKRSVFQRIGGFDTELIRNQDDEHNLRLSRAGGKLYQSPRIQSWYRVRGSLAAVFRQYMQYGYWKVLVIRKHRLPASWRHLVPGAFVAGLVGLLALGLFWPPALWLLAGVALLYGLAVAGASLLAAAGTEGRLFPVLPVVFACFHFGYGYGFLRGLSDFVLFHNAPDTEFVQLTRKRRVKTAKSVPESI